MRSLMNPNNIMKWLGILFVIIGIVVFVIAVAMRSVFDLQGSVLFGVFFLAIFGGVGGFFAKIGITNLRSDDKVLEEGETYLGKIFRYEADHSVTMNGKPLLVLVIRYYDHDGVIRETSAKTGSIDETAYPIGATITFKMWNGTAALVKGSVNDTLIAGEENLMNPDFDPKGIHSSVSVNCPGCGAPTNVPIGMSKFCMYCGRKLSVDQDGKLIE
jgi:hypothetical protein